MKKKTYQKNVALYYEFHVTSPISIRFTVLRYIQYNILAQRSNKLYNNEMILIEKLITLSRNVTKIKLQAST